MGAPRLGADRIIEKAVLRSACISGAAFNDLLLLRTWAECLGGLDPEHFSFKYGNPAKRVQKFPLGRGSLVIHLSLQRQQVARRQWCHALIYGHCQNLAMATQQTSGLGG